MAPAGAQGGQAEVTNPKEGMILQVATGTWLPAAVTYSTQWEHCDTTPATPISGGTGRSYAIQSTDVGHTLCVLVSGWNPAGNSAPITTAPSGTVTVGPPFETPTNGSPKISGSPVVGQTLTSSTGNWRGTGPITYTYQWKRCDATGGLCGQSITGAPSTSPTYVVQSADIGHTLRAYVIATNPVGSATGGSLPSAVITAPVAPTGPSGPGGSNNNKGSGGGGSGGNAGPTGGSQGGTGGSSSPGNSVSVRALLMHALVVNGKGTSIRSLLRHGGYSFSFAAPSAGRLQVLWYRLVHGRRLLVGSVTFRFIRAGSAIIVIHVTRAGRNLLRHAGKLRLTASAGFTPAGLGTTIASRTITLKG